MTFYEELKLNLEADVPAIYVESFEWMRFRLAVENCCKTLGKVLFFWNVSDGLIMTDKEGKETKRPEDFKDMLDLMGRYDSSKNAVYVLEHPNLYLDDTRNPEVVATFAITIRKLRRTKSHVILLAPALKIPEMLKKELTVLDFPLPGRDDIRTLLNGEIAGKYCDLGSTHDSTKILDSVRGLGATEIRNAFAKVAVGYKKITAEEIPHLVAEKEQIIRKSDYLTFIPPDEKMDSIGGLENLKEWLDLRKGAFGEKARNAKLNPPKGVLLLGIPGTGKSLCAKAVAQQWKMPLLRLDMGSIFSSGVGDSEANMRNAIKVAEGLEPCVLWIDEIEKGVAGGTGASGELDGGTSMRVFGSFLTWMQEKKKEVFIFATANNISRLPPEMLRKGRFDEIFFVDLPGKEARKKIFKIHLDNKEKKTDISDELLKKTEGFSGAEIEAIVNDALFASYKDGKVKSITAANLMDAAEKTVPLSSTMGATIKALREWSKERFRRADKDAPPEVNLSKSTVVLRSERHYDNWFAKKEDKDNGKRG